MTMKKLIQKLVPFLLAAILLVGVVPAFAASPSTGLNGDGGAYDAFHDSYYDTKTDLSHLTNLTSFALPSGGNTQSASSPVAGFSDVLSIDHYADAVQWAKESGVTAGTNTEGTVFSPAATVTRARR